MVNRKYGHGYPVNNQFGREEDKYLPSFFLDVLFDFQIVKTEIRPLKKDPGYYTVNMNNIFLAHIRKFGEKWIDFLGTSNEVYEAVGHEIEKHLAKQ
jgi:hypothetical protein